MSTIPHLNPYNKSELSREYFVNYDQIKALVEKDFKALIAYQENEIDRLANMITTIREGPSFYVQHYQNQGNTNVSGNVRNINTHGGNYNESIEGNYIQGNYYAAGEKQTLAEIAAKIQALLEQLDKTHSTDTTIGKMALATEAIAQIENNPNLTSRILSALKISSVKAFEQFLNHPAASFVIGALEDWEKTRGID